MLSATPEEPSVLLLDAADQAVVKQFDDALAL